MAAYDIASFRRHARLTLAMADDQECTLYLDAAVAALEAAGAQRERLTGNRMYELTIYMLALYYHDNRGAADMGGIPEGMLPIVNVLHYTPEGDAG